MYDNISLNSFSNPVFYTKICRNAQHTFYNEFFFFENHALYKKTWNKRKMPSWVSTEKKWLHERATMFGYKYTACLVHIYEHPQTTSS